MVDPGELQARARRVFDRRRGDWLRDAVAAELGVRGLRGAVAPFPGATLEVNLKPPTQREVLRDAARVRDWVGRWEAYAGPGEVTWEERQWASAGTQRLPVRVRLDGIDAIARAARRRTEWRRLAARARDLVGLDIRWGRDGFPEQGGAPIPDDLPDTVRRLASAMEATSDEDWGIVLGVLHWLDGHGGETRYVRELPIRGIDTKWIEDHGRLVLPLARALFGLGELPFRRPPELIRVRALGEGVLPAGLDDLSLTAVELASLAQRPARVVVCENLVSVLTLPALADTLAIFGKGYGAGSRLAVPWLDDVDLYYWGDLDTHGFQILDGFRKSHPSAVSILMDRETLAAHEDLWVEEPAPVTRELPRLTEAEALTYDFLRHRVPAPRLEQERIPYGYVMAHLGLARRGAGCG